MKLRQQANSLKVRQSHKWGPAALAEFERDIIRERTQAGLQAARARGRLGGRPKALNPKQASIAQALYKDKTNSIADICKTLNISRATLYRYIQIENG
jgi:DNA invertase Pin-like site-specific DNA recombinase